MPLEPKHLSHQKQLLISRLLDCRNDASPFTLIFDSLEQPAKPLVREYIRRAKANKTKAIFVSLETLHPPSLVDHTIHAHTSPNTYSTLPSQVKSYLADPPNKTLVILDTLHPILCQQPPLNLSHFLSSFLTPGTSLLAVFHIDLPLPHATPSSLYHPAPLTLLRYLATTLMTVHALPHVLAREAARRRAVVEPAFGLGEGVEGTVQGLLSAGGKGEVVVEVEMRRKSGREVRLAFVLGEAREMGETGGKGRVVLLEDHELYVRPGDRAVETSREDNAQEGVTFDLGLTEKQRKDRAGVVLPYFDAQREGEGIGEGGRILYDIGREDDFDEEEDEI